MNPKVKQEMEAQDHGRVYVALDSIIIWTIQSKFAQLIFLFPIVVLLCNVFGLLITWTALLFCAYYYTISVHKDDRQSFKHAYTHILKTSIRNQRVLPEENIIQGWKGETQSLNLFMLTWWRTSAKKLFKSILDSLVASLKEQSKAMNFSAGKIFVSDNAPQILSINCVSSSFNSIYFDIEFEYSGESSLEMEVQLQKFANLTVPFSLEGISFLGTVRFEMIYPFEEYVEGVECKEQESFSMGMSILEDYLLNFDIKISNLLPITAIPQLKEWLQTTIKNLVEKKFRWPKQTKVFGPIDHFLTSINEQVVIPFEFEDKLKYSENILRNEEVNFNFKEQEIPIVGINLYFPNSNNTIPEGWELLEKSASGRYRANLNNKNNKEKEVYFIIKKYRKKSSDAEDTANDESVLTDVAFTYLKNIDSLPSGYKVSLQNFSGEESFISQSNKNDEDSRIYLACERKRIDQIASCGFITDIQVCFENEIELLKKNESNSQTFSPSGYYFIKIHEYSILDSEQRNSVYLAIKFVGGSKLKSNFYNLFSQIKKQQSNPNFTAPAPSYSQPTAPPVAQSSSKSNLLRLKNKIFKEKLKPEDLGITRNLLEFISNLVTNPDTFKTFPLTKPATSDFFQLTEEQKQHATLILQLSPALNSYRDQMTSKLMSDSTFWYIYFTLVKNKTGGAVDSPALGAFS